MQSTDLGFRSPMAVAFTVAVLLLSGCKTANEPQPTAPTAAGALLALLPGTYSNQTQFDAAPERFKVAPQIGSDAPWIDAQFAEFKRVDAPNVPGDVIALQWRRDGREGPISRQRLWAFRELGSGLVMDFYTLKSEIDFADEAAISGLGLDDLISYGDKCALPVRPEAGAFGMAIPDTCKIISRSGREMTLSAEITVGEGLTYKEAGRFPNGDLVFMVPGVEAYEFERITD